MLKGRNKEWKGEKGKQNNRNCVIGERKTEGDDN